MSKIKTLIVEDDPTLRSFLIEVGRGMSLACVAEARGDQALSRIQSEDFQIILSDVKLPGCGGLDLLRAARKRDPLVRVILMTAFATVELAVDAMKEGAVDFLQKPFSAEMVECVIRSAIEKIELVKDVQALRREIPSGSIVGESDVLAGVRSVVERVAASDVSVLIQGETGVGKELVAKEIHRLSERSSKRLVTLHVPAIADTMIEAELFGHNRGAFTGAVKDRAGLLELAEGGTLFLDEIGDLGAATQVKILRFLQERTFRRVGGNEEISVDVRIVCATNRDLSAEVRKGRFREDLFYRLNVVPIFVPPLRDRKSDIPILARHFLAKYGMRTGIIPTIHPDVMARYLEYTWPGNIRELESVIARASALSTGGEITNTFLTLDGIGQDGFSLSQHLAAIEKAAIATALELEKGVKARAANRLGMKRTTLLDLMAKHGIV